MSPAETVEAVPTGVRSRISRRRRLGVALLIAAAIAGTAVGLTHPLLERAAAVRLVGDASLEQTLRDAIDAGDEARVAALARIGADVNHRYADGLRPLEVAAMRCDRDTVRALEGHGARRADADGVDPALRIAIERCDEDTVRAIALTAVEDHRGSAIQAALAARGDPRIVAAVRGYVP
ncbi:hypothetical protein QQX10_10305 [Demequina sp. SYSU T00039]|uniref:Ankyrin repeat-containing protein n=1 Tax=Demequina lignilytica TaxID=3051663 RepID=A0AAW7M5Z7_9MICO|nr:MULTISPECIES: hypothetical protein [unclassified Demequina]MDN4478580.1 hypothetical protein [Demequina sp. SYSU T00039-1]MDN4488558.1 hypothetical protein [Demequina sp. SYSU T00039]MDN4491565.1 hypothetical protein [Demequina sp. SYSU T00068]